MIAGTSGSDTKLCQPSASQSKITQTLSASSGSRKTVAPLEPCCPRFSAPFVEKMLRKRSTSSTLVVANNISYSLRPGPSSTEGSPSATARIGYDPQALAVYLGFWLSSVWVSVPSKPTDR